MNSKEENKSIKISLWPFLVIILVIGLSVFLASLWNQNRILTKLEKLEKQTEKIYQAHMGEFIEIAKYQDTTKAKKLLEAINAPERGIIAIHVLRKTEKGWNIFVSEGYNWYVDFPISPEQTNKINSIVDYDKTATTIQPLFDNLWWERENLYAFTPIKEGGQLVGFVVVSVHKIQNF